MYLVAIFDIAIKILDFLEHEDDQLRRRQSMMRYNTMATITLTNLLNQIMQMGIHVFEMDTCSKLYQLIHCLRDYQYVKLGQIEQKQVTFIFDDICTIMSFNL